MPTTTLRELNSLDQTPATLGNATLILVDYQNTYTTGVMELTGWQPALDAAAKLMGRARQAGARVIHVINDGGPGTPYDIRTEIGQIHPSVAPVDGEDIVIKTTPNAFVETNLGELIDQVESDRVIIAGFMTHMCVLFTAQGAFLRGKHVTVVADASATRPLPAVAPAVPQGAGGSDGSLPIVTAESACGRADAEVSAADLHRAALATIGDLFGVVVSSADLLGCGCSCGGK